MIAAEMTVLTAMIPMGYSSGGRLVLSESRNVSLGRAFGVVEMLFISDTVLST